MLPGRLLKLGLVFALICLAGCAYYPISKEIRQEARKDVTFPQVLQNPDAYKGSIVIWGGTIIQTVNRPNGTDIFILETPLERQERPEAARFSRGRFIAHTMEFLDPEIYKNGRSITMAGEIVGKEALPLGSTKYTYPLIQVRQLYLWSPTVSYPPAGYDWYWDSPYWPYGYGPWWY